MMLVSKIICTMNSLKTSSKLLKQPLFSRSFSLNQGLIPGLQLTSEMFVCTSLDRNRTCVLHTS